MIAIHLKSFPTPTADVHKIFVCAVDITQSRPSNFSPFGLEYSTVGTGKLIVSDFSFLPFSLLVAPIFDECKGLSPR